MRRRGFLASTLAAAAGLVGCRQRAANVPLAEPFQPFQQDAGSTLPLPEKIAGLGLRELHDDYRHRLFDLYLPFWEKGAFDRERGGFMCELNEDGSVASDEKNLWYQGRAVWVYAFLYNEFGKDPRWLEFARKTREFMLRHLYAGEGRWFEKVRRDGTLIEGVGATVYGWLYTAMGLAEYYVATGGQANLDLVKTSVRAAVHAYDNPAYGDTHIAQYAGLDLPTQGLRTQGHSMVIVSLLTRLLARHADAELESLQRFHLGAIMNQFWNPEFGIQNEYLRHDYSRARGADTHMFTGHSVETLWIAMQAALRRGDHATFNTAIQRIRRILDLTCDRESGGFADSNYFAVADARHPQGPDFSIKTMWAQCEAMVACTMILEHTGEAWSREHYEHVREFTLRTMQRPEHGVWRQAVDRFGKEVPRAGVSTKRKDNFHQVRYLMLDLLALERMLAHASRTKAH